MILNNNLLVSVVIPTFNRSTNLQNCIDSVLKSNYKNIEIIITDDNSNDGTKGKILKKYKNKKINYFYSKNKKFLSYNLNKAIKKSKGELILKLDDDNVLDKNAITEMVSTLLIDKRIGVVGPVALYLKNPNIICHAGVTKRSKIMRRAIYSYANKDLKTLPTTLSVEDFTNVFMFKREAIIKSGLFDLEIPYMGEDSEFQARVVRNGYKIKLCNNAFVYHNIPFKTEKYFIRFNNVRLYHTMRSKILYEMRYAKHHQKLTFIISIPIYWSYYAYRIFKTKDKFNNKLTLLKNVINGTFNGFTDSIKKKTSIEYLDY